MKVTIGGNRLGSGKKMQASLNNYYRSTHDLSETFASTLQCGILYPSLVKLVTRGDTFDIKINQDTRTIPTNTALFGSFKMQTDVFFVPWRLYQGLLHNNPLALGLKMNQVIAPKLIVQTNVTSVKDNYGGQFNNSCLLKYLGMSGIGRTASTQGGNYTIGREILAIPTLGYYNIFKDYYSNKQEENAYVIGQQVENATDENKINNVVFRTQGGEEYKIEAERGRVEIILSTYSNPKFLLLVINGKELSLKNILAIRTSGTDEDVKTLQQLYETKQFTPINVKENYILGTLNTENYGSLVIGTNEQNYTNTLQLIPFNLKNIDDMRYFLLTNNQLGVGVRIANTEKTNTIWGINSGTDQTGLPYSILVKQDQSTTTFNRYPLNGLVVKTYQNDIFNNWLDADWIEGENGIAELTSVQVVDGKFSMDALSFAQKLYNMLNRVAVSGSTYEDWQDVIYEEVKRRQVESPIYLGGCSHEIVFDEIVQTTPTEDAPLGTLGGRGRLIQETQKGGKIHVKVEEAGFIMAITSLTPRIYQHQGNEFFNTEIDTLDDVHKPGMDGIGYQDLIGERMAWWDTIITPSGTTPIYRSKVGKLPAWIEYMTSYDKAYGDFANEYGKGYGMILLRNYDRDEETGGVKDFTTYIDPQKFNYAFANANLDAQNFWVKVHFDIKARRLMSARLIPHV